MRAGSRRFSAGFRSARVFSCVLFSRGDKADAGGEERALGLAEVAVAGEVGAGKAVHRVEVARGDLAERGGSGAAVITEANRTVGAHGGDESGEERIVGVEEGQAASAAPEGEGGGIGSPRFRGKEGRNRRRGLVGREAERGHDRCKQDESKEGAALQSEHAGKTSARGRTSAGSTDGFVENLRRVDG